MRVGAELDALLCDGSRCRTEGWYTANEVALRGFSPLTDGDFPSALIDYNSGLADQNFLRQVLLPIVPTLHSLCIQCHACQRRDCRLLWGDRGIDSGLPRPRIEGWLHLFGM